MAQEQISQMTEYEAIRIARKILADRGDIQYSIYLGQYLPKDPQKESDCEQAQAYNKLAAMHSKALRDQ